MRRWTKEEHISILSSQKDNRMAAELYSSQGRGEVSKQLVRYWRSIFIDNSGNMTGADRKIAAMREFVKPSPDDDIGDISFIPDTAHSILVIPDIHAPYEHPDMLAFLHAVQKAFKPDLVVQLGDELDYHAMSFHDSDPNLDSAGTELVRGRKTLLKLHTMFPHVLVCHSNHGSMAYRRAKAHGIPVQMIKKYRDIVFPHCGAPGWSWAFAWRINTDLGPVMFKHQTTQVLSDAAHNQCNLVVGHQHGNFSVEYSASSAHLYYGAYAGCLIDNDSLAFAYGKHSLRKPIVGCMVILQGRPMLVPMVLDKGGRWKGSL